MYILSYKCDMCLYQNVSYHTHTKYVTTGDQSSTLSMIRKKGKKEEILPIFHVDF